MVLGFDQVTWDNFGQEAPPQSFNNYWNELTDNEKAAAVLLGYNERSWNNDTGDEPQPLSHSKKWVDLTACGENEYS